VIVRHWIAAAFLLSTSCFYVTHQQQEVLIDNIDIDQTLDIARYELQQDTWGRVLTLWAMRDQRLSPAQADSVAELYFAWIDSLDRQFNIWHLSWAVSNMYRNGDSTVQARLDSAYRDASRRADTLHRTADKHVNGDKVYMGDFHFLGRRYKKTHVVAPGNTKYVQSASQWIERRTD
jgi:hypothetical protein